MKVKPGKQALINTLTTGCNIPDHMRGKPTSLKGKNAVRKNAIKHGLWGNKTLLIKGESLKELNELGARLIEFFQPANALEYVLLEQMQCHLWKLKRIKNFTSHLMSECIEEKVDGTHEILDYQQDENWQNRYALFIRHEVTEQKLFYRCLHELERVQARRAGIKTELPKTVDVNLIM